MGQADVIRFRPVRVNTTNVGSAPADGPPSGGGAIPQYQLSPLAPSGLPTQGFVFMLKPTFSVTPAVAAGGGYTVVIWFRDPISFRWGSAKTVSVNYSEMWVCNDVDAMDGVYFQISNVLSTGNIDIHLAEQ